ncbi:MAG: DnaA N-terminal domain-containing protein [bacterium]
MARVPDEAIRRRREISSGAWHLYELYCLHRNSASGLCNPSNTTLAAEMRCSYTHISDSKSELIKKGWIQRQGRQRVQLLVGEFAPLKVHDLTSRTSESSELRRPPTSENSELQLRKIPNFAHPNFGEFRTSTSENSELRATPPAPPIRIEPVIEPVAAAATAGEIKNFRSEPLDDAFAEAIVKARLYPPELVEFVKNKLVFRCAQEGVEPTKVRLLHWLSIEREQVQPSFPSMQTVGQVEEFKSQPAVNRNLLPARPDCDRCHGKGLERGYCDCQICPYCKGTGIEDGPTFTPPAEEELDLYRQLLRCVQVRITAESFETWLVPLRLLTLDRERRLLQIYAPHEAVRDWVVVQYSNLLDQALSEAGLAGFSIEWSTPQSRTCRHKSVKAEEFRTAEAG